MANRIFRLTRIDWRLALLIACCQSFLSISEIPAQQPRQRGSEASGEFGVLVSGSQVASRAGLAMLEEGGNAVDAAVTSMLVQSVLESRLFCFGSEVPIIVYDAKRDVVEVVAGLGAAPRLATRQWFMEHRNGLIQGRGDIANAVVPGFLDACLTALSRYGTRTFARCAEPMIEVLRERAAMNVADVPRQLYQRDGSGSNAADWLQHHQNFLQLMESLVAAEKAGRGDRLRGLRLVADYFYRGPVARALDAWSQANGGLLRYVDMAQHVTRIEEPTSVDFNGYTIYKCDVWTQGPYLLQTMKMLEGQDLVELGLNSADYIHYVTETIKLAMADRDAYFGDPHFVQVPLQQLLSNDYVTMRRKLVDMQVASMEQRAGNPRIGSPLLGKAPQDYEVTSGHGNDTTSCLVADRWGNVVSATPSGWGGVYAGDTGIELGSRMIGLTTWQNHPSLVQPGKRPRITLTPTLVLRDGKPIMAVSVAGGDQQDQTSIQVLLNHLVFGMEPLAAVMTDRFGTDHHINWFGHDRAKLGSLTVSRDLPQSELKSLESRGHKLQLGRPAASAVILTIDQDRGIKRAAGQPGRFALGY
ncbi:MAG TPA: gamma-glutamyltransferase [Pirellulaceae bacterium]|nr:gamma-glutamyltransferase [Pirellulaceae bacterium]HMO93499.1 gamma-glutamyltransferase [Pirellulaceae bacterium]HMP70404.1 gamma-glutamyltransferase [Pirellulaceae bacterium]